MNPRPDHAEDVEEVVRDSDAYEALRITAADEVVAGLIEKGVVAPDAVEGTCPFTEVPDVARPGRDGREATSAAVVLDEDQAGRVLEGHGLKQQRAHDAEHGRTRTHAETDDERGEEEEAGVPARSAQGVSGVLQEAHGAESVRDHVRSGMGCTSERATQGPTDDGGQHESQRFPPVTPACDTQAPFAQRVGVIFRHVTENGPGFVGGSDRPGQESLGGAWRARGTGSHPAARGPSPSKKRMSTSLEERTTSSPSSVTDRRRMG